MRGQRLEGGFPQMEHMAGEWAKCGWVHAAAALDKLSLLQCPMFEVSVSRACGLMQGRYGHRIVWADQFSLRVSGETLGTHAQVRRGSSLMVFCFFLSERQPVSLIVPPSSSFVLTCASSLRSSLGRRNIGAVPTFPI